jgi:hypothetical protein
MSEHDDARRWQYVENNPYRAIDILLSVCNTKSASWGEEARMGIDAAIKKDSQQYPTDTFP